MKAIVGLGNPGAKYRGTRHNIGFAVVDELARRAGIAFESAPADALIAKWRRPGRQQARRCLMQAADVHERERAGGRRAGAVLQDRVGDLLIVVDEVQLPLGKLRARARGSAGGHNGLKSVIAHLGSEFPRLRVGVGRGPEGPDGKARRDLADHVLARFESDEARGGDSHDRPGGRRGGDVHHVGIEAVMNAYNGGDPGGTE